jgi:predicted HicB family RNase H-like nuclease
MAKRIIDGKTYNTETATKIAEEYNDDEHNAGMEWNELFQTRHGAYFVFEGSEYFDVAKIVPLTPSEAQAWMEKYAHAELIEQHFGEMPEAGDSESRFTLRMPDSLKQRIDGAAKANSQSTNAWIVRALEKQVEEQLKEAGGIFG